MSEAKQKAHTPNFLTKICHFFYTVYSRLTVSRLAPLFEKGETQTLDVSSAKDTHARGCHPKDLLERFTAIYQSRQVCVFAFRLREFDL